MAAEVPGSPTVGADVGVASNYLVERPASMEAEIDGDINAPAVVCCVDVPSDKTCLKSLLCGERHECVFALTGRYLNDAL